ncbi:MAG: SAM-dependent methyltransferase [Gemmatimonadetes bacterium]|nr:SAM-dependent methyltransferase [Gemmatimonadota bacterium]
MERIASVCRTFRREATPDAIPGFCRVASLDEIREHDFALTPGRYVGAEEPEEDDEPFEEKFPRRVAKLEEEFAESARLESAIRAALGRVSRAME